MESITLEPIEPVKPVAPYLGGKSRLAKRITSLIETVDHDIYAEAFVGMGGVFLRRKMRPKSEVINDFNGELATFYRVIQCHYTAFMDMMRFQITSRQEFERLCKTNPETLTDLERAARFLYLQRTGFGGQVNSNSFGVSPDRGGRFDISKLGPMLDDLHSRMSGVVIERLSYDTFIPRYDRKSILFYLDPPYYGGENDYGKGMFDRSCFHTMADILLALKGKFILSINDVPEIREIFKGFNMEEVSLNYSIAKTKSTAAKELIITNF